MDDHKEIVRELLATGLTQKELGALLGKSQAWVGAVLAGKYFDLKWTEGQRLRALHAERVADGAKDVNGVAVESAR